MSPADFLYAGLLFFSVAFGQVVKINGSPEKRRLISTSLGVVIIIFVGGFGCFHAIVAGVVNALIIGFIDPSICHIASFIWGFGYIAFFRTCHFIGLPMPSPYSNAVQLLLTLKMVGIAFEVHDTDKRKRNIPSDEEEKAKHLLKCKYQDIHVSVVDIICYSFCYIGILTGPYYKYRTYHDMLHNSNAKNIDTIVPLWRRIRVLPLYFLPYLIGSQFFSLDYIRRGDLFADPFWFRLLYMAALSFIFRLRFYCGWILAECGCMTAGLGAYPAVTKPRCGAGPTDFEAFEECYEMAPEGIAYNFETIHNIDEYGCETAVTNRRKMHHWNKSVQYWLSSNIYKRLTLVKSGALKVAITMTVSAFWHGIHPGYFFSFLFVPLNLMAEDLMAAAFQHHAAPTQQKVFDWTAYFINVRFFEYMAMGFMLLTYKDTMAYWSSIYFCGHILVVILIIIGLLCQPKRSKKPKDERVSEEAKKKL
ncbi:hypothetical protein CAPTEDRAFT_141205 [Capitella teleta]|uniref:Lysophospholipid acyltransferase 7 n=1 Tax=Capitella teleta TaxID=283909 RepID=R7TKS5_CAPTE|nr:hypothetical protein CAPTEDRAFT_141205 [Capitella teleta]|eukprot:ELT92151.1 hypothetical protein CAPTEDRAFT_141205 [Capitella teleta]